MIRHWLSQSTNQTINAGVGRYTDLELVPDLLDLQVHPGDQSEH
jgi:hypothetical protein